MRKHVWILLSIFALATSLPGCAQVVKGAPPPVEKAPNQNRILVPSAGFAGGILTGYVIGPDNNPVPNAPVSLNGGTLMGEVIGDPEKKEEKRPSTSGGPWMHTGDTSVGGPGLFRDWQNTALDFCKRKANPGAVAAASGGSGAGKASIDWGDLTNSGTAASPQWGGFTNPAGGFVVCIPPGTKEVQVSSGGDRAAGGAVSVLISLDQPSAGQAPYDPPFFCGRGEHFDLNGAFPRATAEQDGKVSAMAVAMALGPSGQALSTVECSNNLHPGTAKLSITDGTSHVREFQTHIFQFVDGALDRNQLLGGQPADFWYDVQMGPEEAGKSLCVNVTVAGPVVLTKHPAHRFQLNGDGRARISGKIRATHVAPGSTVPFDIHAQFLECGE